MKKYGCTQEAWVLVNFIWSQVITKSSYQTNQHLLSTWHQTQNSVPIFSLRTSLASKINNLYLFNIHLPKQLLCHRKNWGKIIFPIYSRNSLIADLGFFTFQFSFQNNFLMNKRTRKLCNFKWMNKLYFFSRLRPKTSLLAYR